MSKCLSTFPKQVQACHAIELLPAYVDVAVLRWQAFTGQDAVLETDSASFSTVASTRGREVSP